MSYSFEPLTTLEDVGEREPPEVEPMPPPAPQHADVEARPLDLPELVAPPPRPAPSGASQESELAKRVEQARAEGRRAGREESRIESERRVEAALTTVRSVVDELERSEQRRRDETVERIAVLATAIAGHLVEREVQASPEVVADVVRRAIATFPVNDALTVRLNPSDLALLSASDPGEPGRSQLTSGQAVRWIADPTLLPGGCFVESAERVVDARLSRTLERICRALLDG